MPNRCRSCHAPVLWAVSARTLKAIPLDWDPHPEGNVRLDWVGDRGTPQATTLTDSELEEARRVGETLRRSHWVSCPDAERFRRPRRLAGEEDG